MGITLQDFIDMAIDNYYDCYIWDNEKEEQVFSGEIAEELTAFNQALFEQIDWVEIERMTR